MKKTFFQLFFFHCVFLFFIKVCLFPRKIFYVSKPFILILIKVVYKQLRKIFIFHDFGVKLIFQKKVIFQAFFGFLEKNWFSTHNSNFVKKPFRTFPVILVIKTWFYEVKTHFRTFFFFWLHFQPFYTTFKKM